MPSLRTREFQEQQRALRALTYADVLTLWSRFDATDPEGSFSEFAVLVASMVDVRRRLSAQLAREYLTRLRADRGLGPPPLADPGPLETAVLVAGLREATVDSIRKNLDAGRSPDLAKRNALVNAMGTADKIVQKAGRDLVTLTTERDRMTRGWTRVAGNSSCQWCQDKTGPTLPSWVRMVAHNHCNCAPEPVFR